MDSCCLSSRPGVRDLFSASCIVVSSLDTGVVRRLSCGKYIVLCESHGQQALNGSVLLSNDIFTLVMVCALLW